MTQIGRVIDGRYLVEADLGAGGIGIVVRARHQFTGAVHAVKMLRPDYAMDADTQQRFLREARAPNEINHRGIVQVLDAGVTPEGELYLVMELLVGLTLRAAIQHRTLAPDTVRRIAAELLDALAAAHAKGFIHRDLKPENVFLCTPADTVKLLDFGIAKVMQPGAAGVRTAAGVMMGTPAYMAPEQLADSRGVDPRADLWAVGVMLYELITGRLPYPQRTVTELLVALQRDEPTPIQAYVPTASPQLVAFFARALARDPARRFGSASELAAAFAAMPAAGAATRDSGAVATGPTMASQPPMQTQASYPAAPSGQVGAPLGTLQPVGQPAARSTPMPVAHHAPATASVHAAGTMPNQPPTGTAPPVQVTSPAPPARSRHALAIGLAILAVGLIATAIAIAARGHGSKQHRKDKEPDKHEPDRKDILDDGKDVPVKTTPSEPGPGSDPWAQSAPPNHDPDDEPDDRPDDKPDDKPADKPAPAPAKPAPTPAPAPAPALTRDEFCTKVCQIANTCGLAPPNCMQACVFDDTSVRCMKQVGTTGAPVCTDFAACLFVTNCGAAPSGNWSCAQTAQCQSHCSVTDFPCGCGCAKQMAFIHSQALAQLDHCALACSGNIQCMQSACPAAMNSCNNQ